MSDDTVRDILRDRTLAEVEATFARWIHDDDPIPTRAMLASYVANRNLDGDPVWLLLVGGSGVGKTERIGGGRRPVAIRPARRLRARR